MPAMLEDPTAPTIYRVSGPSPYPTPDNNGVPDSIVPRKVTLRDRQTVATLLAFSSPHQVPPNLLSYLADQLNREIEKGDTYPMDQQLTIPAFGNYWFQNFGAVMFMGELNSATDVMQLEANGINWQNHCLGSFYIKPNYPGRSSHICNGGFLVTDAARNKGVGRLMGEVYLDWAPKLGYTYSVFNLVYETNVASCRIWDALGFKRVGKIKGAGDLRSHPEELTDAIIYGRDLDPDGEDFASEDRFDKIKFYLKQGKYPAGADRAEKSRLRSAATHYRLHPADDDHPEERLMLKDKEVISDPQRQYEIAQKIHSTAHGGINKTTQIIAEKYHWIRIKETVSLVIKNCPDCKDTANKAPTARTDNPAPTPAKRPLSTVSTTLASNDPNREIERYATFNNISTTSAPAPNPSSRRAKRTTISPEIVDMNPVVSIPIQQPIAPVAPMQMTAFDGIPLDPQIAQAGGYSHHAAGMADLNMGAMGLRNQFDIGVSGHPDGDDRMDADGEAEFEHELMEAAYREAEG